MSNMSTHLIELVEKMPRSRVVLVGDFMVDRYVFGRSDRISPEAPIPVLRFQSEESRLGGAGFVLAGLMTLGASTTAVGVIGVDDAAEKLRKHFAELGVSCEEVWSRCPAGRR